MKFALRRFTDDEIAAAYAATAKSTRHTIDRAARDRVQAEVIKLHRKHMRDGLTERQAWERVIEDAPQLFHLARLRVTDGDADIITDTIT